MAEEFTDSFLLNLLDEKPAKKLIRREVQYPALPKGGPVTWHDTFSPNKSLHCASRGCNTPTCYKFKNIPYCTQHLLILLVLELMTTNGRYINGTGLEGSSDRIPETSIETSEEASDLSGVGTSTVTTSEREYLEL